MKHLLLLLTVISVTAAEVKISNLPLSTNPSTNTFLLVSDMDAATKSQKYLLTNLVFRVNLRALINAGVPNGTGAHVHWSQLTGVPAGFADGTDDGGGGGTDDQTAAEVPFTPAGNVAATDVQAAIQELDTEKAAASHNHPGENITSGTVADARIAGTIARDSEVTAAIGALTKSDVGLGNVDNTSDANKPVSSATQTALDTKAATSHAHAGEDITSGTVADARIASTIARDSEVAAVVSDTVYGVGWDGDTTTAPSKNAVYDKIESLGGGGGTDDQTAAEVPFTPAGNIAATDTQAAIQELDTEKQASLGFTPVNKAGDTGVGSLSIASGGQILVANGSSSAPSIASSDDTDEGILIDEGLNVYRDGNLAFKTSQSGGIGSISLATSQSATPTFVNLYGEAGNTLALRNGTAAQTFRPYGTYTDASNYRRLSLAGATDGAVKIASEGAGTGATGNSLQFWTDGVPRMWITNANTVYFAGDLIGNLTFDDPDGNYTATTVQAALAELDNDNTVGPNQADYKVHWSQIGGVPAGFADGTDDGGAGTDDQTAAEVPVTPAGTIAATDVQAALEELDGDITGHDHTGDTLNPDVVNVGTLNADALAITGLLPGDVALDANTNLVNVVARLTEASASALYQATNSALTKITESGGLPIWDGGAWPGGGTIDDPTDISSSGLPTDPGAKIVVRPDGSLFWATPRNYVELEDDFSGGSDLNSKLGWSTAASAGNAAQIGNVAPLGTIAGAANIYTANTTVPGHATVSLGNTAGSAFSIGNGEIYMEWRVRLSTLSVDADAFRINVGFQDARTLTNVTDGVFFTYVHNENEGKWTAATATAGTVTTNTTAASPVAANTWYRLGTKVNAGGTSAVFTVDGTEIATITATIPTTALSTGIAATQFRHTASGANFCNFYMDYFRMYQWLTTSR